MKVNGYEIKPNANLWGADFRGAYLSGAIIKGTILEKKEDKNLKIEQLDGANIKGTILEKEKDYAITIKILTDNDSFGTTCKDTADEVNRILKDLINRIEGDCYEVFCNKEDITLRDSSGNKVGTLHYGEVE